MKKITWATCFSIVLVFGGCATMISGSSQVISVNSNINDADVTLVDLQNNKEISLGKTPFCGAVPRLKMAKLIVKKDGYKPAEIALGSDANLMFLVNVFNPFGLCGTTTDYSNGSVYQYSPSNFMADLAPGKAVKSGRFVKESRMRQFALLNYDRISDDLAAGRGQYLDSIYDLCGAKTPSSKCEILGFVSEAHKASRSIPEFANAMAARM